MTKYLFNKYNNPALELYVEEDYPLEDLDYVNRDMLVDLRDYEYDHFVKTENQYNAVIDWMNDKQEEFAEAYNKDHPVKEATIVENHLSDAIIDMRGKGWTLVHHPHRAFVKGEETVIPNEELADDQAWLMFWITEMQSELNNKNTK